MKLSREIIFSSSDEDIDKVLGFKIKPIEYDLINRGVKTSSENWIGLDPQTLQTPYTEIYSFFSQLKGFDIKTVIDFGAGYGRPAFVLKLFFSECEYLGYENILERVDEGNRVLKLNNIRSSRIIYKDIIKSEMEIPDADLYFIYDFSHPIDLKKILKKISSKMNSSKFFLVTRGKGIRSLIRYKFPEFFNVFHSIESENWSIFSSFIDLTKS